MAMKLVLVLAATLSLVSILVIASSDIQPPFRPTNERILVKPRLVEERPARPVRLPPSTSRPSTNLATIMRVKPRVSVASSPVTSVRPVTLPTRQPPARNRNQFASNTTTTTSSPLLSTLTANNENDTDDDDELLCIFRLYMDSLVSISNVDMNDRLVFLVPLVVIYWRHRHPTHPIPFTELDHMLRHVGNEAQVYRLALFEVSKKVESQCGKSSAAQRNGPSASLNSSSLKQQHEHAKALEALRILYEWIDSNDEPPATEVSPSVTRNEEQLVQLSETNERQMVGATNSRVRDQMRRWFDDLINPVRRALRPPLIALPTRQATEPTTTTAITPPRYYATESPRSTTTTTTTTPASISITSSDTETTTEPYGWPHYENRTTTSSPSRRPIHHNDRPDAISDPTSTPPVISSSSPVYNSRLMNRLRDLETLFTTPAPSITLGRENQPGPMINQSTPPTHYHEFFELASSIIDEINREHNSTSVIPTTTLLE